MTETVPLAALKHAFDSWEAGKASDVRPWVDLMADQIDFRTPSSEHDALPGQTHITSKEDVGTYLKGLGEAMVLNRFRFDDFVVDGGTVLAIGDVSWTVKATGKRIDSPMVAVWRFKNGKAIAYGEFFDSAQAAAAMG